MPERSRDHTDPPGVDHRAERVVVRARELAGSGLEGIEEAAAELAGLSDGDGRVINRARQIAAARLAAAPSTENKQVAALIRRSIEVGMSRWGFEETGPVP